MKLSPVRRIIRTIREQADLRTELALLREYHRWAEKTIGINRNFLSSAELDNARAALAKLTAGTQP